MSECWSEKPEDRPTFQWICAAMKRLINDQKVKRRSVAKESLIFLEYHHRMGLFSNTCTFFQKFLKVVSFELRDDRKKKC